MRPGTLSRRAGEAPRPRIARRGPSRRQRSRRRRRRPGPRSARGGPKSRRRPYTSAPQASTITASSASSVGLVHEQSLRSGRGGHRRRRLRRGRPCTPTWRPPATAAGQRPLAVGPLEAADRRGSRRPGTRRARCAPARCGREREAGAAGGAERSASSVRSPAGSAVAQGQSAWTTAAKRGSVRCSRCCPRLRRSWWSRPAPGRTAIVVIATASARVDAPAERARSASGAATRAELRIRRRTLPNSRRARSPRRVRQVSARARPLRPVHRRVGVVHQRLELVGVLRPHGPPDARSDLEDVRRRRWNGSSNACMTRAAAASTSVSSSPG